METVTEGGREEVYRYNLKSLSIRQKVPTPALGKPQINGKGNASPVKFGYHS